MSAASLVPAMRVVDVVLGYLKAEGVKYVFGIPGGLLHPFFEAVEHDETLELIVTRHEQGAAFMADGFARASRGLAVCAGTSGPGSTNMLTGVACAYADGVPMVVITGQVSSNVLGRGATQETNREDIDIVAMFAPVTKYSTMLSSAETVSHHVRRALRSALTGRQGPVHLNFPVDLWSKPAAEDWFNPRTYRPETTTFDRQAVRRASERLLGAVRPAILAGSGVASAGAEEHLKTLAELLPARVATTPRAKGVFPEDHPLSLGVFGYAGHRAAKETLAGGEIDALLTIGASLNETTTTNWDAGFRPGQILIQNDIQADRIGRGYPVDVPLVGDAQTMVVELVYHLHRAARSGRRPASTWASAEPAPKGEDRYDDSALRASTAHPLTPQRWRAELQSALPPDCLVFSDIGGHMLHNLHQLCIGQHQRFFVNLGFSSMGHGTVAPIGAALLEPRRPVVAIVGDGCFSMNGMELITAVQYDVPVVWIVEQNNMHGITWHGSKMVGSGRALNSVRARKVTDIAGIARAMGLFALVVDRPGTLPAAINEAFQKAPAVIEVRIDPDIPPPLVQRAKAIQGT